MAIQHLAEAQLTACVTSRRTVAGVTAGSALLSVGARLLAVQDDAFRVTWIDPETFTTEAWALHGDGLALPKSRKPDFEAAAYVPDAGVFLLGSGATSQRRSIARLDLGRRVASIIDGGPMYDAITHALGSVLPNIEGALVADGNLLLVHRGMGGQPSACIEFPSDVLCGAVPVVRSVRWLALGTLTGVSLGVTDIAAGPDGTLFVIAAAEATADAIADGPILGTVIGLLGATADRDRVRWAALSDEAGRVVAEKGEGLVVDSHGAWVLTDADDPARAAELCRVTLGGPWFDLPRARSTP